METQESIKSNNQDLNLTCPNCGASLTEETNNCPSCGQSIVFNKTNQDNTNNGSFITKYKIQLLIGTVLLLFSLIGLGISNQNSQYERMVSSVMPEIAERFKDPSSVTILEGYIDKENDGSRYIGLRISAMNSFGARITDEFDIRLNSNDGYVSITKNDESSLDFYTILKFGYTLCDYAEDNDCTVHKLDVNKIRW